MEWWIDGARGVKIAEKGIEVWDIEESGRTLACFEVEVPGLVDVMLLGLVEVIDFGLVELIDRGLDEPVEAAVAGGLELREVEGTRA